MWSRSQRARTILALSCCLFVLLAATGHLLHGHSADNHNKAIADVACSLCAFGLALFTFSAYVPQLTELSLREISFSDAGVCARAALHVEFGRAPPLQA